MAFHQSKYILLFWRNGSYSDVSKVAETLICQGFQIQKVKSRTKSSLRVKFDDNQHPIICFFQKPILMILIKTNFGAIMTCNNADERLSNGFEIKARFQSNTTIQKAFDGTM